VTAYQTLPAKEDGAGSDSETPLGRQQIKIEGGRAICVQKWVLEPARNVLDSPHAESAAFEKDAARISQQKDENRTFETI